MKNRSMVVSLIGRPNVGKSSLFNRLMQKQHKAITHDQPGVTRDRHYGITTIEDLQDVDAADIILVDTGGFYPERIDERGRNSEEENANKFFNIMTDHARMAIGESDLVLFVVDVREGALPFDNTIADYIRTTKKPFLVVANKYDSDKQAGEEIDFYSLGIDSDELFTTSATHGRGVVLLREKIQRLASEFSNGALKSMPEISKGVTPREEVVSKIALIGAPNAGKSTLLNLLVGAQRALVSDIAGTTVDPIEGFFDLYFGKEAKILEEDQGFSSNDGLLFKQYEEFRRNNADVYQQMVDSYAIEEDSDKNVGMEHFEVDYELTTLVTEELDQQRSESFDKNYDQVFNEESEESSEEEIALSAESSETVEKKEDDNHWRSIHIIDTAGIRRQKTVNGFIESQSVYRSLRSITESDVVIVMIDATNGIGHQDRRLIDISLEKGKSVIVALNKMDLMREQLPDEAAKREWLDNLRRDIPWLDFCDIITISAKHNKGMKKLKEALKKTILVRSRNIPTGELNRFVFDLVERNPVIAKSQGAKRFKVKYTSMIKSGPPTFLMFTNKSQGIPEHYRRYLVNSIRSGFKLYNTPVHLIFRTGNDLAKRMKKSKMAMMLND
ncbi:ribosome biogenesis GTPase Der [Halobacteriovorax marinus]|uniref:ribosome biogenesis GTPase Der n=1 Tax=Halobacteriovorax marinus TaxID=97084 RepID=UPI003A9005D7